MSLEPRGPSLGQHGKANTRSEMGRTQPGSVRRAREMMEAGLPMEQQRRNNKNGGSSSLSARRTQPSRSSPTNSSPYHLQGDGHRMPSSSSRSHVAAPPSRPVISVPSPASQPQWPLFEENDSTRRLNNSPSEDRSRTKGAPPQRPPRPSYVPSFLDASQTLSNATSLHNCQPQQPQRPQPLNQPPPHYWDHPCSLSPRQDPDPPRTTATGSSSGSSRASTSSSFGSIPDFPIPNVPMPQPQQIRRSANLGPPPSSRRGASSYYSQSSYVAPIPEEVPEANVNTHGLYASSPVVPKNRGEGPTEYYLGDDAEEGDEDAPESEERLPSQGTDHGESTGLVRKVSLGKRHKPSLTTIRSSDELKRDQKVEFEDSINRQTLQDPHKPSLVSRAAPAADLGRIPHVANLGSTVEKENPTNDSFKTGTGFLDASSSSNGDSTKAPSTFTTEISSSALDLRSGSPISAAMDARVRQIMGGLERGGALESGTPAPATENCMRRPPRLNMDAVKETEARGSLTSLPDLIRRATKLASNLDRGRTASRLGVFDLLNANGPGEKDLSRTFVFFRLTVSASIDKYSDRPTLGLSVRYVSILPTAWSFYPDANRRSSSSIPLAISLR